MGIACERRTWAADHSANSSPSSTNSNFSKGKRRRPLGERSGSAWSGAQDSCRSWRRQRRYLYGQSCSWPVFTNVKENGGGYVKDLELSKEAKDRLAKLKELSNRAANGDKKARGELRRLLRESGPEVIREASEIARIGQQGLIKTAACGDTLAEEALIIRLDTMRSEIAGLDPSPLEALLAEKLVSAWILTEVLELFLSAQLTELPKSQRMPHSFLKFYL